MPPSIPPEEETVATEVTRPESAPVAAMEEVSDSVPVEDTMGQELEPAEALEEIETLEPEIEQMEAEAGDENNDQIPSTNIEEREGTGEDDEMDEDELARKRG